MQKDTNPPFPYKNNSQYNKLIGILNKYTNKFEYYTVDSRKLIEKNKNPKSQWFIKKWLYYNHGTESNQAVLSSTDNILRGRMNSDSELYGDIGIPKIN